MVLCMIVASTFVMPVQAQDDTSITVKVAGPTEAGLGSSNIIVGLGSSNIITITISGGPAGTSNGTYGCTATVAGYAAANTTLINTGSSSSATGVFEFNLSTPQVLGDLTVNVHASSTDDNNSLTTYNNATSFDVKVVAPIVFTVNIKNTGNMTVTNIPVYFWVDYVDNTSKPVYVANVTVNALSTKAVTYNWTTTSLGAGSHELKVQIDPNATFISFDVGGTNQTTTFYYNQSGYGTTNALLYVALVVLLIVVYLVYRRPMPRKKK
jgi:hypothetical protein